MTDNVTPIRKPEFATEQAAAKVTAFAQRLGVKPGNPVHMPISFPGNHGEHYCVVEMMTTFLDKIEALHNSTVK